MRIPLPLRHGKWIIELADSSPHMLQFIHDDYDPTPLYADDGPSDNRAGFASDIEDAIEQINDLEDTKG